MIWVLIFAIANATSSQAGVAAGSVEFNTLEACKTAAAAISRQVVADRGHINLLLCTAKGAK